MASLHNRAGNLLRRLSHATHIKVITNFKLSYTRVWAVNIIITITNARVLWINRTWRWYFCGRGQVKQQVRWPVTYSRCVVGRVLKRDWHFSDSDFLCSFLRWLGKSLPVIYSIVIIFVSFLGYTCLGYPHKIVVCRAVLPSTASPGGGWGSGL